MVLFFFSKKMRGFVSCEAFISTITDLNSAAHAHVQTLSSARWWCAPMVEQSELAFRRLVRSLGADVASTPMVKADAFVRSLRYRSSVSIDGSSGARPAGDVIAIEGVGVPTLRVNIGDAQDEPLVVQFCGDDPATLAAACRLVDGKVAAVELNLGCPQACAAKGHYGSFLLDEADLVASIVAAMRAAAPRCAVLCKIRVLETYEATLDVCRRVVEAGCDVLTVHGRTRAEKRSSVHLARWDWIARLARALAPCPVVANGNVRTRRDAEACIAATGACGVMSASSLLRNPALFAPGDRTYSRLQLALAYIYFARRDPPAPSTVALHVHGILKGALLVALGPAFGAALQRLRTKRRSLKTDSALSVLVRALEVATTDVALAAALHRSAYLPANSAEEESGLHIAARTRAEVGARGGDE